MVRSAKGLSPCVLTSSPGSTFPAGARGSQEGGGAAQADNALLVKQALHLLEDAVEKVDLPSGKNGLTRNGHFVYDLLGHAGITCENAQARVKVFLFARLAGMFWLIATA